MPAATGVVTEAMAAPKLFVDNIHKTFFKPVKNDVVGIPALNGISFSIAAGDFVSIIGPSGCGKSTLLRIVDGLIRPDQGRVLVDGQAVNGPGPDRAVVFQYFGLYPWRSVLRNVEFGLELKGMPRRQRRDIALSKIAQVGLHGFENHFPHELSGGMRQRVGFARALSLDPEIILMDEPFSSVDEQTRELLQEQLLELWRETRKTILFVTHSIDEAVYMANRVVVMAARPGRIVEDIAVDLPRPRTGSMRTLPRFGEIRSHAWELLKQGIGEALAGDVKTAPDAALS
jgi:NitT/TauT family transport system ATP-binding protein